MSADGFLPPGVSHDDVERACGDDRSELGAAHMALDAMTDALTEALKQRDSARRVAHAWMAHCYRGLSDAAAPEREELRAEMETW